MNQSKMMAFRIAYYGVNITQKPIKGWILDSMGYTLTSNILLHHKCVYTMQIYIILDQWWVGITRALVLKVPYKNH